MRSEEIIFEAARPKSPQPYSPVGLGVKLLKSAREAPLKSYESGCLGREIGPRSILA